MNRDLFNKKLEDLAISLDLSLKQLKQDIVYLNMCFCFASLSKARRLKVGEMIHTEQGVLIPGYNGTAPNTSNDCEYVDEKSNQLVSHQHIICGLQNCVYKSAREGVSILNSTAYSTDSPCVRCGPIILSTGIKRFVYTRQYRLIDHMEELKAQGVQITQIPIEILREYQVHYCD